MVTYLGNSFTMIGRLNVRIFTMYSLHSFVVGNVETKHLVLVDVLKMTVGMGSVLCCFFMCNPAAISLLSCRCAYC